MNKQCFVIMPYGANDAEKRRYFEGVFHSIIKPAATAAGLVTKRSDFANEPGNITHDIIRDLAESEIVVADLTSANANVFFELGIRHAFRKSGTVHIISTKHDIPFDIRQYRAIEYSTDLADIPETISKITDAINKRIQQPERPDNPVHDALPQLPLNIAMVGDAALREQLRSTQESLEMLHREREDLAKRLSQFSPLEASREEEAEINVDALLDHADEIAKTTGPHALLKLKKTYEDGGAEEFIKVLRQVLKSSYVEENDFMEIVVLCKQARLDDHRRAALEVARRRYPYSSRIFLALVDALDDSPNQADQQRGRSMLEQRLGIEHSDRGPILKSAATTLPLQQAIALLFNFYARSERHSWIVNLFDTIPVELKQDPMILRNLARSFARLNRLEESVATYEKALSLDPTNDQTLVWYADFLDDQGRYTDAYKNFEKAILADPDDGNLFLQLGIHMLNRGYYRVSEIEIAGPIPRKTRAKIAVPILKKALETNNYTAGILQQVVRVLVRGDAIREAEALAAGKEPEGKFERFPLEYLVNQIAQAQAAETETSTQN